MKYRICLQCSKELIEMKNVTFEIKRKVNESCKKIGKPLDFPEVEIKKNVNFKVTNSLSL